MGNAPRIDDELIVTVLRRAATDQEYRALLLHDPRTAINQVSGQPIPEHVNLRFIEKPADVDALFVLPDAQAELPDEALEAVAGGSMEEPCDLVTCGNTCGVMSCITTGTE